MMMLFKCPEMIDALASGQLVHFSNMQLTQKAVENPVVFEGPGLLRRENGQLSIIIYHSLISEVRDGHLGMLVGSVPGQMIPEHRYYTLSGTDINGQEWESDYVFVSAHYGPNSVVVTGALTDLRTVPVPFVGVPQQIKYHLTENVFTSHRRRLLKETVAIDSNGCKVVISNNEGPSFVEVRSEDVSEALGESLLKALEVVTGKIIQLDGAEFRCNGTWWYALNSNSPELVNDPIDPPVESVPSDSFGLLISQLHCFFHDSGEVFWGFWHKINRAWQAGIASAALTVSVSIEGILKSYFSESGKDDQFKAMALAARECLESLAVDDRVKNYLNNSLSNAGGFNAKAALRDLEGRGLVKKQLVSKWNRLRNKSAHADSEKDSEMQGLIDLTYSNLDLFYCLLFILCSYSGSRVDYDCVGFPL